MRGVALLRFFCARATNFNNNTTPPHPTPSTLSRRRLEFGNSSDAFKSLVITLLRQLNSFTWRKKRGEKKRRVCVCVCVCARKTASIYENLSKRIAPPWVRVAGEQKRQVLVCVGRRGGGGALVGIAIIVVVVGVLWIPLRAQQSFLRCASSSHTRGKQRHGKEAAARCAVCARQGARAKNAQHAGSYRSSRAAVRTQRGGHNRRAHQSTATHKQQQTRAHARARAQTSGR